MSEMLPDEVCHNLPSEFRFVTAADLLKEDNSGQVILHNTMRFDVQLAHIYAMIDDGDVDVAVLAEKIRSAIIAVVDEVIGVGLDGRSIPGGAYVVPVAGTKMLHRETIGFDLS